MISLPRRRLLSGGAAALAYNALKRQEARAQSPCGTFYPPTPPSYASGYKLKFRSDFTLKNEVDPTGTATSGYNWYIQGGINASAAANAPINTTATASGSFASPFGGILALNGPNYPGDGNVTICSTPESTQGNSIPATGCWTHGLFELYGQMSNITTATNNQWWAYWFDTQVDGNSPGLTELDTLENFMQNFGYPTSELSSGGHQWNPGDGQVANAIGGSYGTMTGPGGSWVQTNADTGYHKFGMLWVQLTAPSGGGSGTGYVEIYYDDVAQTLYPYQASPRIPSGTGGQIGYQWLEYGQPIYCKLGGPPGFNFNIDYFQVWQPS